ncbi:hypothetical protein ABWK47_27955, partial [Bacillus toyonensis]
YPFCNLTMFNPHFCNLKRYSYVLPEIQGDTVKVFNERLLGLAMFTIIKNAVSLFYRNRTT